jgi:Skp family chaperone for outer membrane proteins
MAIFGRREAPEPASIDAEFDRLRAIRTAAEQELGRLRKELAERVATVEKKERELADAIAKVRRSGTGHVPPGADEALAHAEVGLAARAQELNRWEDELAARERRIVREEAEIARKSGALDTEARLAQIETRLTALQEAEKAFARTQAELAAQSEDLARREKILLDQLREGALDLELVGGSSVMSRAELVELDERLRRLEQQTRRATEDRTFTDGLRTLERRGVSGMPPS